VEEMIADIPFGITGEQSVIRQRVIHKFYGNANLKRMSPDQIVQEMIKIHPMDTL
jgi:hypothetical protein